MTRNIRHLALGVAAIAVVGALTAAGVLARGQYGAGQGIPGLNQYYQSQGPQGRFGPDGPPPGGPGGPGGRGPDGRRGGPGGRGRGGPGGPMGGLGIPLDRLGLTEAQRQQVDGVMQSHRPEMEALNERAMASRQALEATMMSDTFDEGAIRARSADVGAVETDIAVARARLRTEVFKLLTPEQQAQAKEMQEQRPKGRMGPPPR